MKLTAQDLQIGDWVKLDFHDTQYADEEDAVWKNGKITAIHHGNWVDINFGDVSNECDIEVEDIEPIPITPEILEKNGFENVVETCYRYILKEIGYYESVRVYTYEEPIIIVRVIDGNEFKGEIKYVHQLQQAMRLCGIKGKEIIL